MLSVDGDEDLAVTSCWLRAHDGGQGQGKQGLLSFLVLVRVKRVTKWAERLLRCIFFPLDDDDDDIFLLLVCTGRL